MGNLNRFILHWDAMRSLIVDTAETDEALLDFAEDLRELAKMAEGRFVETKQARK